MDPSPPPVQQPFFDFVKIVNWTAIGTFIMGVLAWVTGRRKARTDAATDERKLDAADRRDMVESLRKERDGLIARLEAKDQRIEKIEAAFDEAAERYRKERDEAEARHQREMDALEVDIRELRHQLADLRRMPASTLELPVTPMTIHLPPAPDKR